LEVCKWLHNTFQITREEAVLCNNYAFRCACTCGHLEVCEWLHKTFQLKKEEINFHINSMFGWVCFNENYEIIIFLCNTFNITNEEIQNIIKYFSKKDREKILDCFVPFGSFTKPVKNK
jgi:hypothetical protein